MKKSIMTLALVCMGFVVSVSAAQTNVTFHVARGPRDMAQLQNFWAVGAASIRDTGSLPASYQRMDSLSAEPFAGSNVVIVFVDHHADASQQVALADETTIVRSGDPGNILGETNSFGVGKTYSSGALLIKNGQTISSGPVTQSGERIIYAFGLIYFNATAAEVRGYFNQYPMLNAAINIYTKGVLVASQTLLIGTPRLIQVRNGANWITSLEANGDSHTYTLASSPVVGPLANWQPVKNNLGQNLTLSAGGSLTNALGRMTLPSLFVRVQR